MHSLGNASSSSANTGALRSRRGKQHLLLIFWSSCLSELGFINRNTEGPISPLKVHVHSFSVSVVSSHCYYRYWCRHLQQETGAQGIHVLGKHSDIEPTTTLHPPAKVQVGERLKLGRGKEGIKQARTGGSRFSKGGVTPIRLDRQEQRGWVGTTAELEQTVGLKRFPGS